MTFEGMKDVVKSFCNIYSDEADLRIGRSLNRHYRRVTATCGLDTARFVTRTETTTNGVQTVTFSEIEKIDRITDTTSGVDPLTEKSLDHQRSITPGTGAPRTWAKQSTTARTVTVRLDTVPQDTYTLQADGWATLSDLKDTDEPVFAESFHDILTWAVIAEELLKKEKEKLALVYETKAETLLRQLQHHLADSYSQVTLQRNDEAVSGSTSGSGGTGSSSLGHTAYTQDALVTFDLGSGVAPFAIGTGAAKVDGLDADLLDGHEASEFALSGDPQIPIDHATSHENGGTDEISVTGLSGLLADGQTPLAHKTSHENNGSDEISVTGLSGLLADEQTPLAHVINHKIGGSDALVLSGTWTPVIGGSGGTTGQTYSTQLGMYLKVDKLVFAWFTVVFTAKGTITSNLQLQGLPFTIDSTSGYAPTGTVTWVNYDPTGFGVPSVILQGISNSTTAGVYVTTETGAGAVNAMAIGSTTGVANNSQFRGTLIYQASS